MTDSRRHHRDLFDPPEATASIPISAQAQMLDLLKALLTEALASGSTVAGNANQEAGDDQDHA